MQVEIHMFHGYDNPWFIQYQSDSIPEGGQIREYLESNKQFQPFGLYVKEGRYFEDNCLRLYELYQYPPP